MATSDWVQKRKEAVANDPNWQRAFAKAKFDAEDAIQFLDRLTEVAREEATACVRVAKIPGNLDALPPDARVEAVEAAMHAAADAVLTYAEDAVFARGGELADRVYAEARERLEAVVLDHDSVGFTERQLAHRELMAKLLSLGTAPGVVREFNNRADREDRLPDQALEHLLDEHARTVRTGLAGAGEPNTALSSIVAAGKAGTAANPDRRPAAPSGLSG